MSRRPLVHLCWLWIVVCTVSANKIENLLASPNIKQTTNCGFNVIQVADNETGTFTSPNFPSNYPNNALCVWTFSALDGYRPLVTVKSMSTESTYDSISFYDGPIVGSNKFLR